MKVTISNDKEVLKAFITDYLHDLLTGVRVYINNNEDKQTGVVDGIGVGEENTYLTITIDGAVKKIPIQNSTKVTIGTELVCFETKQHATVIEIL